MASKRHAKLIQAWLDGEKIQWRHNGTPWRDCDDDNPEWSPVIEYRIKPAEPEREYPRTQLTGHRLAEIRDEKYAGTGPKFYLTQIVNDAFRHACDNGQIVTRAEFDRAVGDRQKRDMAVAQAVSADACRFGRMFHTEEQLSNIIASVK